MTIEQLDSTKVLISLCSEDMEDFKLKFNDMSFCSEHSKRILLRLLQLACSKAGVSFERKTVLMEALPHNSGCLLLLTMMEKNRRKTYKVKKIKEHPCFVFENAEELLSAAENLQTRGVSLRDNSLWVLDGKYYLMFNYPFVSRDVCALLREYSRRANYTFVGISRIKETGKLLCDGNALGIIAQRIKG